MNRAADIRGMNTRSGLVLVVEDERNVREPLAHLLQMRDYEVVSVDSVDAAIEALDTKHPDAAIVDLHLRGGSGREVVEHVPGTVPVIIFSGMRNDSGDIEHQRPQTRFVEKPCSLTWLIETLGEMIDDAAPLACA
jgi:DNA-binding NtrC family response regulator